MEDEKMGGVEIAPESQPIYDVAQECLSLFQKCPREPKHGFGETLSTSQERFRSWAAYLGVFALKNVSLDTRLRFEPEIRDLAMLLLDVCRSDLRRAIRLASKGSLIRRDSFPKEGAAASFPGGDPLPLSKEAKGALYGIVGSIDRLHRLAVRIRTSSRDDQKLEERVAEFAKKLMPDGFGDIVWLILKYKFPKANEGLIEKLTKSIVFRRHRLLYQRHHYKKLSYVRFQSTSQTEQPPDSSVPIAVGGEQQHQEKQQPSSQADLDGRRKRWGKRPDCMGEGTETEFLSNTNPTLFVRDRFDRQDDIRDKRPAPTVVTSGSSWVGKIVYPCAPKAEGASSHTTCPFCFQELRVVDNEEPKWWKRHVDSDLQHFICLSDQCPQSLHYFSTFTSWLDHMESEHEPDWPMFIYPNSSEWRCPLPRCRVDTFPDAASFKEHIAALHSNEIDPSDLELVADNSRLPQPRETDLCPLCHESVSKTLPPIQDDETAEPEGTKETGKTKQSEEKRKPRKAVVRFVDDDSQAASSGETEPIDGDIKQKSHQPADSGDSTTGVKSTFTMAKHISRHLENISFLSLRGLEPDDDEDSPGSGSRLQGSDHSSANDSIAFECVSERAETFVSSETWAYVRGNLHSAGETAPAVFAMPNTSRGRAGGEEHERDYLDLPDRGILARLRLTGDEGNNVGPQLVPYLKKKLMEYALEGSAKRKVPEFLAERLADAMVHRRRKFLYLRKPQRLWVGNFMESVATPEEEQGTPSSSTNTISSSVFVDSWTSSKLVPLSVANSETTPTIPRPPAEAQSSEEFRCPYCRLLVPSSVALSKTEWRNHFIADTEPYFCLLPDCATPSRNFSSMESWVNHMGAECPQQWRCKGPGHPEVSLSSSEAFINHVREAHAGRRYSDDELPKLADCVSTPLVGIFADCPFCGKTEGDIARHVANMLETVALGSTPLPDQESRLESDLTQLASSLDSGLTRNRDNLASELPADSQSPGPEPGGDDYVVPDMDVPEIRAGESIRLVSWGFILKISQQHRPPYSNKALTHGI